MRTKQKVMVGSVLALTGIVVLLAMPQRDPVREPEEAPRTAVSVSRPVIDRVYESVRYIGRIEGAADADLSFRGAGTIAVMFVSEGERVAAGSVLAVLDQPESAARIERARSEVDRAEANRLHWLYELEVDERLLEKGAIPRTRRDQTALSLANAQRSMEAAAAGLREAEALADIARLRAPHAGIVARIERSRGEVVAPGQPVIRLSAGARRVQVDVLERDVVDGILIGTEAVVETRACGSMMGMVSAMEPAVRAPLRSVRVYVETEQPCIDGMVTGSEVSVTYRTRPEADAVLVPVSALDLRAGSPRLFRLDSNDAVEVVNVELGVQRDALQQVRGPVRPDDRIVISGGTSLRAGDRVRVREEPEVSAPGGHS